MVEKADVNILKWRKFVCVCVCIYIWLDVGYRKRTDSATTPATHPFSPSSITPISSGTAFKSSRKIVAKRASWPGRVGPSTYNRQCECKISGKLEGFSADVTLEGVSRVCQTN